MATTGQVIFSTGAIPGSRTIFVTGSDSRFALTQTGAWPAAAYTITSAVLTFTRGGAGNVGTWIRRTNAPEAYLVDSAMNSYWTGDGSAALKTTPALYVGLTEVTLSGAGGTAGTIAAGSVLTITVTWQLAEEPSTYTLSPDPVNTGSALTMTVSKGEGVMWMRALVTLGDRSVFLDIDDEPAAVLTIPENWAELITSGTTATASVYLHSFNGYNNLIGSATGTVTIRVNPAVVPTVRITVTPQAERLNGKLLAGIGYLSISATAEGAYGSTISTYTFPTGSAGTVTTTAASYTTEPLTNLPEGAATETRTITVTVTDSRGRTATATAQVLIYAYLAPSLDTQENRSDSTGAADPEGEYIHAAITPAWSQIDGNTGHLLIQYGVDSLATAVDQDITQQAQGFTFGGGTVDSQYAWRVRYTLTDAAGGSVTVERTIPTGGTFMVWDPIGQAVGFGGYPGGSKRLYISDTWDIYIGQQTLADYIRSMINNT